MSHGRAECVEILYQDTADSALGGQTGLFPEIGSFVYLSTLLRRRALDDVGAVAPYSARRLYLILYRTTLGVTQFLKAIHGNLNLKDEVCPLVLTSQFRGIWRLWHVVADLIRAEIRSARLFMNLRIELSAKLLMAVVLG